MGRDQDDPVRGKLGEKIPELDPLSRGSSPLVGSSRISTSGSFRSAWAIPYAPLCPPGKLRDLLAAHIRETEYREKLLDLSRRLLPGHPFQGRDIIQIVPYGKLR